MLGWVNKGYSLQTKIAPHRGGDVTLFWWRELDLNQRPFGYEPNELPGCSIPRYLVQTAILIAKCAVLIDYNANYEENQEFFKDLIGWKMR